MLNSINHARKTNEELEIILNCRKSTIYYKNSTSTDDFDVPMSTQIADLVEIYIYILDTVSRIIDPNQIGLLRDDGHIFILESNSPKTSRI